jgi:hypothetical protein
MSDLKLSLAILGALVLGALVVHSHWQIRRAGPKRAAQPGAVLPASSRQQQQSFLEPSFEQTNSVTLAENVGLNIDDSRSGLKSPIEPSLAPAVAPPKRWSLRLDALIDAIAPINLEAPISGEMLLSHLPASRRAGSKPMLIEGLNAQTGQWEFPQPHQRYSEIQAGVQLANRTGALNNIEFSEFAQKLSQLADAVSGMADMPEMLDVTARAKELDAFASAHDAQLAVHLQARGAAWSVGYILQHGRRHGFVLGAMPGRLVLPAHGEEGAPAVLTLTFDAQAALAEDPHQAAVKDVTLSFDVPQTDPQSQPFVAWQASAQALSLGMDASVVDDSGQALTAEGFAAIHGELTQLYEALSQRDMAAGSAVARRLFS